MQMHNFDFTNIRNWMEEGKKVLSLCPGKLGTIVEVHDDGTVILKIDRGKSSVTRFDRGAIMAIHEDARTVYIMNKEKMGRWNE